MNSFSKSIFLALLLIVSVNAFGQLNDTSRFVLERDQTVGSSIKKLSEISGFRFFHDKINLDTLTLERALTSSTVEGLLDQLLLPNKLTYYHFKDNYFIVPVSDKFSTKISKQTNELPDSLTVIGSKLEVEEDKAVIIGSIISGTDDAPVIGATIMFDSVGTVTDTYGTYKIEVKPGVHEVVVSYIGWNSFETKVYVASSGEFDVEIFEKSTSLDEVIVRSKRTDENVSDVQMSVKLIEIESIKELPTLLGEIDVYRVIQQLPGVTSVGEGSSGVNVRGGDVSQNLILLNGIPLYNSSHLFGFFSLINGDMLSSFKLLKGGIKPEYGGRTSSVLSMSLKEADMHKWSGQGSLNTIATRLTAGGPVLKGKSSILVGSRFSYSDYLLNSVKDPDVSNSEASFYDIGLFYTHRINEKNKINLLGYFSNDDFAFSADTVYNYNVGVAGITWTSVISENTSFDLNADFSFYEMNVKGLDVLNQFNYNSGIGSGHIRANLFHTFKPNLYLKGGLFYSRYAINPSSIKINEQDEIRTIDVTDDTADEFGGYLEQNVKISNRLQIMAGIRIVQYRKLGGKEYLFEPNESKELENLVDTIRLEDSEVAKAFTSLEPRFGLNYTLSKTSSIKMSYHRMRQFIHQFNNTVALSPFSIWRSSNTNIQPQLTDQIGIGYFRNFKNNLFETSVELYHKWNQNIIEYKNSAEIANNEIIETEVINANGISYGLELFIEKSRGKVRGWLSYTYSRSLIKTDSEFPSEEFNNGDFYPSNFDKPHIFSSSLTLDLSKRWSFSSNFTYSTGRPFSAPTARYNLRGIRLVNFSERNQVRIPDYHRLDVSLNLKGNLKANKKLKTSWSFGVYNLYARKNPYSVFFGRRSIQDLPFTSYQLSILARPIPYASLNIKWN